MGHLGVRTFNTDSSAEVPNNIHSSKTGLGLHPRQAKLEN